MKVLVVLLCSLTTLARGSLEPIGYRPPGAYPQTRYLPPSLSNSPPDNRYVSSSFDPRRQDLGRASIDELSRGLTLPSYSAPVPFSNYLPANRQASSEKNYLSTIDAQPNNLIHRKPATEIRHSFTQALPTSDFLPPRRDSQRREDSHFSNHPQSNLDGTYPTADEQSIRFSSGFSGHDGLSSIARQSKFVHQHGRIAGAGSDDYSSGYADQRRFGSGRLNYQSPENQTPAQYDFEYEVRDNFGNDYGHKETRNGESTQGVYKVLLPDGRRQIVHYEADSHGYRPTITYERTDGNSLTGQSTRGNNHAGYHY